MNRSSFINFGYSVAYKPNSCSSSNPPSPATSTSSELDIDSSAAFCDSFCAMDLNREVSPYAHSGMLTPHSADARRASNVSTDASRTARTSKRNSRSSKIHQEQSEEGHVLLEKRVVRSLLLYVRESRLRLHENETKLHNLEKKLEDFQKSHEQQMIVLAKSFVFLQNQLAVQSTPQNSEKGEEKRSSDARLSGMPGELCSPDQRNDEDPDFVELDTVATASRGLTCNNPSAKPLYAVVNKKRISMTPDSPPLPPPPSNWTEDTTPFLQAPPITPLDLNASEVSNSDKNLSRINSQTSSQSLEELSEISSLIDNCRLDDNASPMNSETEDQAKFADHKKYRPLPQKPPNHSSPEPTPMAKRCSGDGFYIPSPLNRRRSSGRYETVNEEENQAHMQSFTPGPRPKASQLLSKFKKKLKDTKRIVARAASKDSIVSESPSISEPVFDDRIQVTVATGSVNVIAYKDDSNNNNFFYSTGNLSPRQRPTFFANPPQSIHSNHRRLDSTGDNESRSTDTSDIHLNENALPNSLIPPAPLYRRPTVEIAPKTRWLESKAPSSPNLLQPPSKSPMRRSGSLTVEMRLRERRSVPELEFPGPPTDSTTSTSTSQGSLSNSNELLSSEDSLNKKLDEAGY